MAAIAVTGWSRSGRATAHLQRARKAAQRLANRLAPSALSICGLGCIDIGVFDANTVAGWIATGVSLLVLEYRIDE